MIHEMRLDPKPFAAVAAGSKTVEVRLYDEKRLSVAVGDRIIFRESGGNGSIRTVVTSLYRNATFRGLFEEVGCAAIGCRGMRIDDAVNAMYGIYTPEREREYGVIGIGIRTVAPDIKVIAHVKNSFPDKFGLPRQGSGISEVKADIVLMPEYSVPEALRGLEGFSHIWVIWGFSLAEREGWSPTVRPPRLGGNRRMGVFATRSPFRPNPIGLTAMKIDKIDPERGIISCTGADMTDGTPVYDIKPYLPFADSISGAAGGFADENKDRRLTAVLTDKAKGVLTPDEERALTDALEQDPRPQYIEDPGREYGFKYCGKEVRFTVDGGTLTVISIS